MIPQEFATFPFLTVLENLWISKNSSRRKAMTDEIFQIFPALQEKINQEASTLSGGQRQMLALGMGLARKCDILLLDEPTLGLSPLMTQRILNSIKEISDRFKLSVLISEQTPLVLNISDRVYVLEGGQIRIQGASQELKKDERIRKVYLGMAV
jgi:branched-chain amino acid transport system ATP-binding protein